MGKKLRRGKHLRHTHCIAGEGSSHTANISKKKKKDFWNRGRGKGKTKAEGRYLSGIKSGSGS